MKNVEQTGTFEEKYFVVNIGLEFLIDDLCKIYSVCAVKYKKYFEDFNMRSFKFKREKF